MPIRPLFNENTPLTKEKASPTKVELDEIDSLISHLCWFESEAKAPVLTFLKELDSIRGFTVRGVTYSVESLENDPDHIFISWDSDESSLDTNFPDEKFYGYDPDSKPAITIRKKHWEPSYSRNDNVLDGCHRYILTGTDSSGYKGGKRAVHSSEDYQARGYINPNPGFEIIDAYVFYTSYLPDLVEELVYSLRQIGSERADELEPLIAKMQEDFQQSYAKACEQALDIKEQHQTALEQYKHIQGLYI